MKDVLEKFTSHSRNALQRAVEFALAYQHPEVSQEHLLYGLLEEKGSISSELLVKSKLEPERLRKWIMEKYNVTSIKSVSKKTNANLAGKKKAVAIITKTNQQEKPAFSESLKKLIKKSMLLAHLYQHQYVGTEHLLAAMLEAGGADIRKIVAKSGINLPELEQQIITVLKTTSKFPDLTSTFQSLKESHLHEPAGPEILEYFAIDLTNEEYQKRIDPVFCREDEITRVIQILLRRSKNNPLLLGEPGVGKTAIVEGLAKRICQRQVPDLLLDKKIVALDMGAVVAGSMYRGEFESRLKQIIEDVTDNPDAILFIDEIHTIVGAGAAIGSLDAANILKPALARGEIRCIGATTFEDFRKYIEKDQALARRFQPVSIKEPGLEQTVNILKGVKKNFERYHRVKILDGAIETAVKLAERYLPERFFPDKAIDLIDEAAAQIKLQKGISPIDKKIRGIKAELEKIERTKRKAILDEHFEQALELKKQEKYILGQIDEIEKIIEKLDGQEQGEVTGRQVGQVVAKITGLPLDELVKEDTVKLLGLEQRLAGRIVGQNHALAALADCIKRNRLGLNDVSKPIGSFVFLGPSGVGKTETAKALAEVYFQDPKALIRLDMSEYGEKFNVSKLLGAPAGYVGHDEAGLLSEQVRKRPYAVVLFDEFEKAHPDVYNLLLQILDAGEITDSAGRKVNFKNTIVILTSNLGTENFAAGENMGFLSSVSMGAVAAGPSLTDWSSVKDQMAKSLKERMRPELLNRFDKVIYFDPLSPEQINQIFELKIKELEKRLRERRLALDVSPSARQFIIGFEADSRLGARLIQKNIAQLIESPLANLLLEKDVKPGLTVRVKVKNKKIVLE